MPQTLITLGDLNDRLCTNRAHLRIKFLAKKFRVDAGRDLGWCGGRHRKVLCTVFDESLEKAIVGAVTAVDEKIHMELTEALVADLDDLQKMGFITKEYALTPAGNDYLDGRTMD